jgi:hypothetical protein
MSKAIIEEIEKKAVIKFEGNIIPLNWFKQLTHADGKAYLVACIVLSELRSYCFSVFNDLDRNDLIGYQKEIKFEEFKKSYAYFNMFGLTKKQAFDACHYLEEKGIIKLETKTDELPDGRKIPNTLFIKVNADMVQELNKGLLNN